MKITYSIILVFSFAVGVLCGKQFPSFIKKCKRNDPQLDDCIKNAIINSGKYTLDGIKEFRIASRNPLRVEKAVLYSAYGTGTFTDIKMSNGNIADITYFKIDLDNPTIWLNVTFPYLELDCNYTGDGKIINIAFHGEGKMIANFTNTNVTATLHGEKFKKDDQEYIRWKNVEAKILEDSMKYFYLTDLFKGNPQLTQTLHDVVRENQQEITKDVIPAVADIFGQVFLATFNGPFTKFSLNELFD